MTLSVGGVGEDEDDSRDSLQVDEDAGNKFGKEEEKHLGIKEEEEQADAVHKGAGYGAGGHRASQEVLPDQDAAHYPQCTAPENATTVCMCTQECCDISPTLPTEFELGLTVREDQISVSCSEGATAYTGQGRDVHTGRASRWPGVHTVLGAVPASGTVQNRE